ncbi:MAG: DUF2357 domain-containing protein [Piscirickettsiaceae bacterium]|nr:DUF2357 domain-containing protein [Piscirickettsiaceae bacterium]
MPELLNIETVDWTLLVWSKDVTSAQTQLKKTLAQRDKTSPVTFFRFDPVLYLADTDKLEASYIASDDVLFFENKLYEFDFQFHHPKQLHDSPVIKHRLQAVEDAFHYSGNSCRGSINFGNHIGWFKLVLEYQLQDKIVSQAISFEVLPTKMDVETDLAEIQQVIDQEYPLFRFSFAQKTEQELARSRKPHERFPLLWLAQFESLRKDLEKGIKQILQAPHSRLLPNTKKLRAEQLKGRLSPRLEEKVQSALKNKEYTKRYQIDAQRLSVDTPENRFIKMVLVRCSRELSTFVARVKEKESAPENNRLSETFFNQLNGWNKPLVHFLKRPFFREVGDYEGLNNESLVLHQKTGYAHVYRVWQQLKLYLDVFGHHASISMKSIAELYEVWCVLEVRRLLIDELGFEEISSKKSTLYKKEMEIGLRDGMGAAFNLERGGVKLRLAHEPVFRRSAKPIAGHIYSWITTQKPDILLEAEFENGDKIRWIFDAKYRIAINDNDVDYAPDDAINQMHRYRDALIHIHKADDGWQEKTRPIFGAFVLYPGWFDSEETKNPYQKAIYEVGIGAFPLLPNSSNHWLKDFLIEQFGLHGQVYKLKSADHLYVREAPRIAYAGMSLSKYKDLSLAVALGSNRTKAYLEGFRAGKASWYHMPESTSASQRVQREVMRELTSCAFVVYFPDDEQRRIEYSYSITSVRLVKRQDITNDQAGAKIKSANVDKYYWLFELGQASQLSSSIDVAGSRDFKFRLTHANDLIETKTWAELPNHYEFLQNV